MAASPLGASLLGLDQDVLGEVLQKVGAAALCQLKAASVAWRTHARRELFSRLCCREGQPEPTGVASITDLDVQVLNGAGRPWEVVVAGRQLPQLARLHGFGLVVDVQAVRQADVGAEKEDDGDDDDDDDDDADAPLGGAALRRCIQGEGEPPHELLLAAVACAASGKVRGVPVKRLRDDDGSLHLGVSAAVACAASGLVRGVPVQRLREDDAIDVLDLDYSGLGVISAELLSLMLPAATSVRTLCLNGNQLCGIYFDGDGHIQGTYTAEGITKLCEGLKGSAVTSLSLKDNNIGDQGASALAAVLNETEITHLSLAVNGLGPEGGAALADGLKGNSTLQVLGLHSNNIGERGASALAAILKETQITKLDLHGNHLGPKGGAALALGLKGNSTLQRLDLRYNGIGDEGASALAAVLKETQITNLCLGYNRLDGQAKQTVRDAAGSGVSIEF